jgi:ketosteroid isomerase-like protein
MNRRLCSFVATCTLVLSVFANEPKVVWKPVTATDKMLLALTQQWADAEVKRDADIMGRVMDDRFIATFGAGPLIAKTDYIKAVVDDPDTMLSQTLTDETIVVEGDTAVLVGTVAIRSNSRGKETTHSYRYTVTYIKRGERWAALALHMVKALLAK